MACPALHELAELLVGNRVPANVRAHVDSCAACTRRLEQLRHTAIAASGPRASPLGSARTELDSSLATAETQTPDGGPPERASRRLLHRGETVGRYIVSELLGAGGMGVVYAAHDPQLDRRVAVKVLRAGFAKNVVDAKHLLLDEAKAMAKLSHPNVVVVHDVGVVGGQVFLAMELVEGQTLRELMRAQPPSSELLQVLVEAGRGLAAAHRAGLVHRDFKPENVLIGRDGRVCVTDFGIAKSAQSDSGEIAGTPMYMAPEAHDGVIDPRSDQYSFCATVLEALTGEPPTIELGKRLERAPARLRPVLARGLSGELEDRYPDMDMLLRELAPPRRRLWLVSGAIGLVAGGVATAAIVMGASGNAELPCTSAPAEADAIWSASDAAVVRAAFGAPSDALERAIGELDAWRGRFVAEHTRVCRATRVEGTQSVELLDLRMECLRGRAAAIRAIVGQLQSADSAALAFASTSVGQAGDLARCSGDRDALRSLAVLRDPQLAGQADRLRTELADVEASHHAGRLKSLVPRARDLAARAEAMQIALVVAPARYYEGFALAQIGDMDAAMERLRQANLEADRAGDDELRLKAQLTLAQLHAVEGKLDLADELVAAADATVGRLGKRPEHVAAIVAQRARSLFARGEYAKSLALGQQAFDELVKLGRDTEPYALAARLNIGANFEALGKRTEARSIYEQTIADVQKRLGKDSPTAVPAMTYLASLEIQDGKLEAARARLQRGNAILDAALGTDAVQTTISRGLLATIYAQAGEPDRAKSEIQRALELTSFPGARVQRAALQASLGDIERGLGRFAEAIAAYDIAIRELEAQFGAEHPGLVEYLARRADAKRQRKDHEAARADLDRAIAITRARQLGELDQLEYFVAQNARDAGRLDEARAALGRCASAGPAASQPMMTALCEYELAKLLPARERARALELARRARGVFAEGNDAETVADIDAWLSQRR